jgi:hypothetical protein
MKRMDKPGEAAAIFDANGDGLQDIVVVNGTQKYFVLLNSKVKRGRPQFRIRAWDVGNREDGFHYTAKALGLHDFDNDGALDLHLCVMGKGTARTAWQPSDAGLLRSGRFCTHMSRKDGTFVYEDFGVDGVGSKRSAVFEDFDGDGNFDCFLNTSAYYGPWYSGSPAPCQLYPGTGRGHFGPDMIGEMLVSAPANFWADGEGNGKINFKGAVVRDFDNDGRPDIASCAIADVRGDPFGNKVTPDDGPAYQGDWNRGIFLFRNVSSPGRIRFEDVSNGAIADAYGRTGQMHGTSVVPADLNNDGRLDLVVTGPRGETAAGSLEHSTDVFRVYRNESTPGEMKFIDATQAAGLGFLNDPGEEKLQRLLEGNDVSGYTHRRATATAAAMDVDNDGDVDVVTTGALDNPTNPGNKDSDSPSSELPFSACWVLLNGGNAQFTLVRPADHGLHVLAKDFTFGDLNNDGRLDIVAVKPDHNASTTGGNHIFLNRIANGNHYLKVNVGSESNKLGIGTKVIVYEEGTENIIGYDEVRTDFSYRSKKSTTLHFGLGRAPRVDVKLIGRNGHEAIHRSVAADAEHTFSIPQ